MRKASFAALLLVLPLLAASPAAAATGGAPVVISEIYAGGGNTQPSYANDFVELFNRTRSPVDLTGWKLEYSSVSSSAWSSAVLRGPIPAFKYFLVRYASGGGGGTPVPTPDATGSSNLARAGGEVRLVGPSGIVDLVGYGSRASVYEGGRAPSATNNAQSVIRLPSACQDTNRNDKDFKVRTPPGPRNRSMHGLACGGAPVLQPIGNKTATVNHPLSFTVSATDPDGDPLTFSATGLPTTATFSPSSRTFSWTPKTTDAGSHSGVTFVVSDGFKKDSEAITITVREGDAGGRSSITLSVVQQTRRLVANGNVAPNHAGDPVTVRLLRWQSGRYQRVAVERTVLNAGSAYDASFARPSPGHCVVSATFHGDEDHTGSTAEREVRC